MGMDAEDRAWLDELKAKGHMPKMDERGNLDVWVCAEDIHNGPGCEACGDDWCMHCVNPADIKHCDCIELSVTVSPPKWIEDGR